MKKHTVLRAVPSLMLAGALFISNATTNEANVVEAAVPHEKDLPQRSLKLDELPESLSGKTVILMSNDSHGALDGFAYMPALEKVFTDKGAQVVSVDCGDFSMNKTSTGDYVKNSKGTSALNIMDATGYDVIAPGNHEFDFDEKTPYGADFGGDLLARYADRNFTTVCANAVYPSGDGTKSFFQDNCVYSNTGINIGFFGLDTGESTRGDTDGLEILTGDKLYQCAQNQVNDLRNNDGAEIVVCLAHLGVDNERKDAGDRSTDVYAHTEGIDIILDANSHTVMTSMPLKYSDADLNKDGKIDDKDKDVEGPDMPIMSTGAMFENIGVVILDKDGNGNVSIEDNFLINKKEFSKLTTDPEITSLIQAEKDRDQALKDGNKKDTSNNDNDKNGHGKKDKDKDKYKHDHNKHHHH